MFIYRAYVVAKGGHASERVGYRRFPVPKEPETNGGKRDSETTRPLLRNGMALARLAHISLASSRPHLFTSRSYLSWTLTAHLQRN